MNELESYNAEFYELSEGELILVCYVNRKSEFLSRKMFEKCATEAIANLLLKR